MKLNLKTTLTIFFMFAIVLVFFSGLTMAGYIKHTIYSPLGHEMHYLGGPNEDTSYDSELSSNPDWEKKEAQSSYDEIDVSANDDVDEIYCKIGGQYTIETINDASPGAPLQRFDEDLYYCKTTKDIIDRIQIPSEWKNSDDLILYCNDGGNINFGDKNFDFITSRINTYKSCILKNLELTEDNTILFGFDVGNRVVDDNEVLYFNTQEMAGGVTIGLKNAQVQEVDEFTTNETKGMVWVPYIEKTKQSCYSDEGGESCTTISDGYRRRNSQEALSWVRDNVNENIVELEHSILSDDIEIIQYNCDEMRCDKGPGPESKTPFDYKMPANWSKGSYKFNDDLGNQYWFEYNSNTKFYSLRNFDDSPLDTDITEAFDNIPADFDVSRVALFKKINGKSIYGYERASMQWQNNLEPYNKSIKPAYIIDLSSGFEDFSKESCNKVLGVYEFSDDGTLKSDLEVYCREDMRIEILSENLDGDDSGNGKSFHLFKNIITTLE